jgi:guanylate kinase
MSNKRRGLLLVIASPSGAGKTSMCRRLAAEHEDIDFSVSATTRAPRPGEADGREYHFLSTDAFAAQIEAGAFLEWAHVHGHLYGTPRAPVMSSLEGGRDVLFDIDWQGAAAIAGQAGDDTVRIFILPPSMAVLEERLRRRAQDDAETIARRLVRARDEIAHWSEFDYVIVNEDFERAYAQIAAIYGAERLRRARNPGVAELVATLVGARA